MNGGRRWRNVRRSQGMPKTACSQHQGGDGEQAPTYLGFRLSVSRTVREQTSVMLSRPVGGALYSGPGLGLNHSPAVQLCSRALPSRVLHETGKLSCPDPASL